MIRIYVANLGAYNAGRLIGEWINLPMDEDELDETLHNLTIVDETCGEELAIHDYEAPFIIHECDSISKLNRWAEALENSKIEEHIARLIFGVMDSPYSAIQVIEAQQYRVWDNCNSMEDVVYASIEENGLLAEAPDLLQRYFDYEAYGRDLEIEGTYTEADSRFNVIVEIIR